MAGGCKRGQAGLEAEIASMPCGLHPSARLLPAGWRALALAVSAKIRLVPAAHIDGIAGCRGVTFSVHPRAYVIHIPHPKTANQFKTDELGWLPKVGIGC